MKSPIEVSAVYFPAYHRTPHNDSWYGEGWTEWDLVKKAPPRFKGHHQPLESSWGCFDDADPAWSEREIDLAADHGITSFMIDWYWYSGVQLMQEQLEKGFLRASNRKRLKFWLMWANHSWADFFPMPRDLSQMRTWLPLRHSLQDCDRVIDYCVEHYFREPNYLKIEDRPVFAFYSPTEFQKALGGEDQVREALKRMNARMKKAGFAGLYCPVNIANIEDGGYCWGGIDNISRMKDLGYDSVFGYNIARSAKHNEIPWNHRVTDYQEIMDAHQVIWSRCKGKELPYFPTVTMGYDNSARWHPDLRYPLTEKYLGETIVINNTPERYGQLIQLALKHLQESPSEPKLLLLNAWNEWPEGSILLPEKRYGTGYLEQLRDALKHA